MTPIEQLITFMLACNTFVFGIIAAALIFDITTNGDGLLFAIISCIIFPIYGYICGWLHTQTTKKTLKHSKIR